jgi:hypothetical protein
MFKTVKQTHGKKSDGLYLQGYIGIADSLFALSAFLYPKKHYHPFSPAH